MSSLVSVLVPAHRDLELVARSLPRILSSSARDLEVVVVNADPDQAAAVRSLVERLADVRVRVVDLGRPSGFAAAINRGLAETDGQFVVFANSDLFVTTGYVDAVVGFLQRHPRAGCAAGRLLRYDLEKDRETDVIDTTGLVMHRSRRVFDRGENERDEGQFDRDEEVFGVSGAALVARREALESVELDGQCLDEAFHMYKEDVDLCWRLRLAGWECWYVAGAVAYHARTSHGLAGTGYLRSARRYRRQVGRRPTHVRMNSMRNQWLMLIKNDDPSSLVKDLPHVLGRESLVLGYNLISAPRQTASAVRAFFGALPHALASRRAMKARRAAAPSEIRRWLATGPERGAPSAITDEPTR
jgi:GT2 family glycosyltransferase